MAGRKGEREGGREAGGQQADGPGGRRVSATGDTYQVVLQAATVDHRVGGYNTRASRSPRPADPARPGGTGVCFVIGKSPAPRRALGAPAPSPDCSAPAFSSEPEGQLEFCFEN